MSPSLDEVKQDNRSFTVIFYNSAPYSVDVYWINLQGVEVKLKSNLVPKGEFVQITYFNNIWLFRRANTDNRMTAEANTVTKDFFEGSRFGALVNATIRVTIRNGKYVSNFSKLYIYLILV